MRISRRPEKETGIKKAAQNMGGTVSGRWLGRVAMRRNDQNVNVAMEFRVVLLPYIQVAWSPGANNDIALLASGDVLRGST